MLFEIHYSWSLLLHQMDRSGSYCKITTQRVFRLYCKNIMCRFGLPGPTVSKNGTQLACAMVTNFYRDLGVQIKFVSVIHLQASGQIESTNKVILNVLKKKLDDGKCLWA